MNIEQLSNTLYEDLNGEVSDVIFDESECNFIISFDDPETLQSRKKYKVICSDVVESTLVQGACGRVLLLSTAPILAEHNEPSGTLSFSRTECNPYEVLGRIYEIHEELFEGFRPLSKYINTNKPIVELLSSFGVLANGPISVLKAYQSAIEPILSTHIGTGYDRCNTYKLLCVEDEFLVCNEVEVEKC